MKIAIGADHAGFALKERLREKLVREGHEVIDHGTRSADSTDYPDYAAPVAHDVASGAADRGILVCYTGVGMSISANKVRGIRAALGTNVKKCAWCEVTTTPTCSPWARSSRHPKRPRPWWMPSWAPSSRAGGTHGASAR